MIILKNKAFHFLQMFSCRLNTCPDGVYNLLQVKKTKKHIHYSMSTGIHYSWAIDKETTGDNCLQRDEWSAETRRDETEATGERCLAP